MSMKEHHHNLPEIDTAGNIIFGTDVTSRYTFDSGQRDTIYDVSRIVLKPGFRRNNWSTCYFF